METIKLKLNSPITDEQWNIITDAELEHSDEIEFTTPSGKKVMYAKVRHGKWKIKAINTFELSYGTTGYEPVYQCSECGGVEESYLRLDEPIMPEDADFPRYCPHCGAKMEEED